MITLLGNGMRVLPPRPPGPSLWSRVKAWIASLKSEQQK